MKHITVRLKGQADPSPVPIPDHPDLFQCPFCSCCVYTPVEYHKIMAHLASHKIKSIQHGGFTIHKCGLGCGGKSKHFHCCYCSQTYINKKSILNHLTLHSAKLQLEASPGASVAHLPLPPGSTGSPSSSAGMKAGSGGVRMPDSLSRLQPRPSGLLFRVSRIAPRPSPLSRCSGKKGQRKALRKIRRNISKESLQNTKGRPGPRMSCLDS